MIRERRTIHGLSLSAEYALWGHIKNRCHNPKAAAWKNYGGRGITVCDRWLASFDAFREDMGRRPPGKTLERIDNALGYSPENCRWASYKEQARNTRTNRHVTVDGERMCLLDAAARLGCGVSSIYSWVRRNNATHQEAIDRLVQKAAEKNAIMRERKRWPGKVINGVNLLPEYQTWKAIKQRCYNVNAHAYHRYGARGITMCSKWKRSFPAFLADMGHRPPKATIERVDNDLGYSLGNCRWISHAEQTRNRSSNRYVVLDGERLVVGDAMKSIGRGMWSVHDRMRRLKETHQEAVDYFAARRSE